MDPTPVLHLVAGPNGSGKSTFVERVLQPSMHLPFVNADVIAAGRWPDAASEHAYKAAEAAADERTRLLESRISFITGTVFSHRSKVDLVHDATNRGFQVSLHVMLTPEELTVARVDYRVTRGGHSVPEQKIRDRYQRLWLLLAEARDLAERTAIYDNSRAKEPFRVIATYARGIATNQPFWPPWAPTELR